MENLEEKIKAAIRDSVYGCNCADWCTHLLGVDEAVKEILKLLEGKK